MKIAYDHQIFSFQKYGGVSRYFVELAKNISQVHGSAADVRVIAPLYKNEFLACCNGGFKTQGWRVPNLPIPGRLVRYAANALSSVALERFDPDVIHETYYSGHTLGPAKAKRVLTVYDMIHELLPESFTASDQTRRLKSLAIARADHVLCISESTQNDLVSILGIDKSKTSVVHLGFTLTAGGLIASRESGKPFLLYVGLRGGYKNFEALARAYAASPQLRTGFDLICFGGGPFDSGEIGLFKRLNLSRDSVRHVAGDDELLARYYASAAVFVYPSLYEGFGIPPLEAMSYGCAVACSNTSSIPEVVGDAAILFDPSAVGSISDALETVLFESAVKERLIARGFQRVKSFSWQKCANETFAVYQQVLQ